MSLLAPGVVWLDDPSSGRRVLAVSPLGVVEPDAPAFEWLLRASQGHGHADPIPDSTDPLWTRARREGRLLDASEQRRRHHTALRRLIHQQQAIDAADTGDGLAAFHTVTLDVAHANFEQRETTVSHLYRRAHPAFLGRSYGEAVADACLQAGALAGRELVRVLEIGGGTGDLAAAFLGRLQATASETYARVRYHMLDASPVLLNAQRSSCEAHAARMVFQCGDVGVLSLGQACFDLVLANEVIADLPVTLIDVPAWTPVQGHMPRLAPEDDDDLRQLVTSHLGRHPVARCCYLNVGAMRLVDLAQRALAPSGTLILTEYGTEDGLPAVVPLPGHREFSVQFSVLQWAARRAGLMTRVLTVGQWLDVDGTVPVVHQDSRDATNLLLRALGRPPLERRPFTREEWEGHLGDLSPLIHNVRFTTVDDASTTTPFGFLALIGITPS